MASGQVITNNGLNLALKRIYGLAGNSEVTRFKVGSGTTTPAAGDTDLQTPVLISGAASKLFVSGSLSFDTANKRVTVQGFLASTECNGNVIAEVGEINAEGVLFSHDVLTTPITKNANTEIQITWTHNVT